MLHVWLSALCRSFEESLLLIVVILIWLHVFHSLLFLSFLYTSMLNKMPLLTYSALWPFWLVDFQHVTQTAHALNFHEFFQKVAFMFMIDN